MTNTTNPAPPFTPTSLGAATLAGASRLGPLYPNPGSIPVGHGGVVTCAPMAACPPRKLDAVLAAMRAGDWPRAITLAAKFPRLGAEACAIMRANEAIQRPAFQRQLKRDPAELIAAGRAALQRRYGADV